MIDELVDLTPTPDIIGVETKGMPQWIFDVDEIRKRKPEYNPLVPFTVPVGDNEYSCLISDSWVRIELPREGKRPYFFEAHITDEYAGSVSFDIYTRDPGDLVPPHDLFSNKLSAAAIEYFERQGHAINRIDAYMALGASVIREKLDTLFGKVRQILSFNNNEGIDLSLKIAAATPSARTAMLADLQSSRSEEEMGALQALGYIPIARFAEDQGFTHLVGVEHIDYQDGKTVNVFLAKYRKPKITG